eukprot:5141553-Pleurochrysis_carterae.AAC.1
MAQVNGIKTKRREIIATHSIANHLDDNNFRSICIVKKGRPSAMSENYTTALFARHAYVPRGKSGRSRVVMGVSARPPVALPKGEQSARRAVGEHLGEREHRGPLHDGVVLAQPAEHPTRAVLVDGREAACDRESCAKTVALSTRA